MKNIFKYLFVMICFPFLGSSQDIDITNIHIKGGIVEVRYNLLDERIDRSYAISLYTSKDNFVQPMQKIDGDIGIDIAVGNNKVVYWNAKEEFGSDFAGNVSLELKGNYYVPFINIDGLKKGVVFSRGKAHEFVWSGGRGDNVLQFDLYQGDKLVKSFEDRPNVGNTTLNFPSRIKPGENYTLKISDTQNRDEVVITETFTIKRKIPLILQLSGAALVGAGAVIIYYATRDLQDISEAPVPNR
jgi:hypothetical protein